MANVFGITNIVGATNIDARPNKSVRGEFEFHPDSVKFANSNGKLRELSLVNDGNFLGIPRQYDTIVDIKGEHDFKSIAAAYKAGHKKVYVLPGTYIENRIIKIPDRGCLIGPSPGSVYIVLTGNARVEADAGGPFTETGTVSITNSTSVVTGTGTNFDSLDPGQFIKLRNRWYSIASIASDTSLTISETYYGYDLTNTTAWAARKMFTGVGITNVVVTGGNRVGLFMRGCRRSQIHCSAFDDCAKNNFEFRECATMGMTNVAISNSQKDGLLIRNCSGVNITAGSFENNAGNGVTIEGTTDDMVMSDCIFTSNSNHGLQIGGNTEHVVIGDSIFVNNNVKGLATNGNNIAQCTIEGCTAEDNGNTGFDFDGDNSVVSGCIIRGNGNHGIAVGNAGLISNNQVLNNNNRGIHITNTKSDVVVTCNSCSSNGAQGIRCAGDNVLVANNNCVNNGSEGIVITGDCAGCVLEGNACSGNTGNQIRDNGTETIIRDNIGLFDKPRSRFQSVKTSNQQDIGGVTPVAITFDANDYISSDFTHTSGNADITINDTGDYKICFQIFYDGDNARKNIECAVYVNGTLQEPTATAAYSRNNTDDKASCTLPPFELALTATDVVNVRGVGTGSAGTANTELNRCWIRIERTS